MFIFWTNRRNKLLVLLSICTAAVFTTRESDAQQIRDKISVSLPERNIRLDSLSEQLRTQSGYILSFNSGSINPATTIVFPKPSVRLVNLMEYLKIQYNLSYTVVGNHIILDRTYQKNAGIKTKDSLIRNRNPVPRMKDSGSDTQGVTRHDHIQKEPNEESHFENYRLRPIKPASYKLLLSGAGTSSIQSSISAQPPATEADINQTGSGTFDPHSDDQPDQSPKTHLTNKLFVSAGLTADESFYFSPTIKIGLPYLYITGLWRTNFSRSGFGYGIGSSFGLSKKWRIQVNAARGKLKRTFTLYYGAASSGDPTPYDTTLSVKITGTLLRGALLAETRLNDHIAIQFGPDINLLTYRIHTRTKRLSDVTLFPDNNEINKRYELLDAPFPLSESFNSEKSSGKKIWIGLQVGVFYFF
jgi:hypothetical protein